MEQREQKMKLVVTYTDSDGCTYSCDMTKAVEYESEEAFAVHFEEAVKKARDEKKYEMEFAGHSWYVQQFFYQAGKQRDITVYDPPYVYTLEDWWEHHKKD
jgi:hypothetical protein